MEGMPHSLFLDPFQEPSAAPDPNTSGSQEPADAIEVVSGEVVDSAAASDPTWLIPSALIFQAGS